MISPAQVFELAEKYQLAPYEVEIYCRAAIEQAISESLRMDVRLDGSNFISNGRTIKKSEITSQVMRNVKFRIDAMLCDARQKIQFDQAIRVENTLVWGEPVYRPDQDHITVMIDDQYVGYASPKAIPTKEQGAWMLAGSKAWYVNHVSRNDRRTLVLNRTSVQLPALLTEALCASCGIDVEVKGIKRNPGVFCLLAAYRDIPDTVVSAVKNELNETVKVVRRRN